MCERKEFGVTQHDGHAFASRFACLEQRPLLLTAFFLRPPPASTMSMFAELSRHISGQRDVHRWGAHHVRVMYSSCDLHCIPDTCSPIFTHSYMNRASVGYSTLQPTCCALLRSHNCSRPSRCPKTDQSVGSKHAFKRLLVQSHEREAGVIGDTLDCTTKPWLRNDVFRS